MRWKEKEMEDTAQANIAKILLFFFEQDEIHDLCVKHRKYLKIISRYS
jgi:hypothetical protein